MADLPSGIITFLFTDIEGSTELVAALGDRYPALLARHNAIVRAVVSQTEGVEVGTEGDAFFVAFRNPRDAVQVAVYVQRTLHAEEWPDGREVRIRIGLHTGQAILGGDNYVGLEVHRASRIAAAGNGGQILVSESTRALVERDLPDGTSLHDLGMHRLKGLPGAERIYQLTVEDLPSDFPAIRSLEQRPNNLPLQLTSFVGRAEEMRAVADRLSATRLLTMTGPGGSGKTRLALRVAEEVIGEYRDGCWFVPLEAVRDAELLPSAIADALGAKLPPNQPLADALASWLADRELLLILDNFEQIDSAEQVARLLAVAPGLRILATSRSPLHLYGEQEYPVQPLATGPASEAAVTSDSLSQFDAVRLFIERALAVKPDFRVTNANAPVVAEICARLDGLPLAIELAAARVKLLTPEAMLARLQQSLSLLVSAAKASPERQRTLVGAIGWSYDLLNESEQRLFARLSIFRGGFTLEAADATCGDSPDLDVFDGVASLFDKSLVHAEEVAGESRFAMLQTVREYAQQRLTDAGESDAIARRHTDYFFDLAARAEQRLLAADQMEWLARLTREHDNLRAAFSRDPLDDHALDAARTAAGAVWRFWQLRGHLAEARSLLDRLLALPGGSPTARAKALGAAGSIAYWQNDLESMARHYAAARELYEGAGDIHGLAEALYNESFVPMLVRGDLIEARALVERALKLYRQIGDTLAAAEAESALGFTYFFAGDAAKALPFQERAVAAFRAAGAGWRLADNLSGLTAIYAQLGDWTPAMTAIRESLDLSLEMQVEIGQAMLLSFIGAIATWVGERELGIRLAGKGAAMRERLGGQAPAVAVQLEFIQEQARQEIGDQAFQRLLDEGRQLSTAEAIGLAKAFAPPPGAPPIPLPQRLGRAADETDTALQTQTT